MDPLEAAAILAAGAAAGAINAVVGSGTLITFPVLLAFGYSPVLANVSNNIGLVPGALSGLHGYRRELRGQRDRLIRFGAASLLGGALGASALLLLPASSFRAIVSVFIALALVLILLQPRLDAWLEPRRAAGPSDGGKPAVLAVLASGVYGGYFGGAQGILLLAILGLSVRETLQRINGLKIALAMSVNLVASVIFVFAAQVAWTPALLIAAGSVLGGQLGARAGRRLEPRFLRAVIVLVGVAAIAKLILG
ncbi:MAG: sulfite exporter TauE/SafE family protein [Solirubrobacteraceae bacterium]